MRLGEPLRRLPSGVALLETVCDENDNLCDCRILDTSPSFEEMVQEPKDALIGKSALQMLPNLIPQWIDNCGEAASSNEPIRFECDANHLGRSFEVLAFCLGGDRYITLLTDISERKEIEGRIKLAECTLNTFSDAVYWLNSRGRFVYANNTACKLTGYSVEELLEMTVHDLNPNFPRDAWPKHLASMEQKGSFDTESIHRKKDGTTYQVSVSAGMTVIEDETYMCAIARDISKQKEVEENLRMRDRLEATATLAGGIAHDFNNLMTGVLGNAELLQDSVGRDPTARRMLSAIIDSAKRAGALAAQMLAFAGGGKLTLVRLNLNQIIKDCLRSSECAFNRSIRLESKLDAALWEVMGDEIQVCQVVINLVNNAIEAIPGEGRVRIETKNLEADAASADMPAPGKYVRLRVKDDGAGMSPEIVAKIFDPFFTTKFPGRGLGLAAVHGIIQSHDGTVSVQSKEGKGSVFEIHLPALEPMKATIEAPSHLRVRSSEGCTILVVEDEPIVQDITRQILERHGYRVLTADDGEAAVTLVGSYDGEIHAAVLDLEMPQMRGCDALPLLKKLRPRMAVVLSSGHDMNAVTSKLLHAGADAFIQKPFRYKKLIETVDRAINQKLR